MKTLEKKNTMETSMSPSLHFCGCCKRELPKEAFYINRSTQTPDNYCKECRKANARKSRVRGKSGAFRSRSLSHPVITEVKDRELRLFLIHQARQVVAESMRRKREKEKLRELWEE